MSDGDGIRVEYARLTEAALGSPLDLNSRGGLDVTALTDTTVIRLSGRWRLAARLVTCAIAALFTGRTTLRVRRRR